MPNREDTQLLLGTAIGEKYDVLQWIGGGGMAGVYLARHRIHGGFCAVKVLADHLAHDPGIVQQFLQEARTAANLDGHPNVVRIVDIGENEGLHYLIMQYIEGEDLAGYLQRVHRLTPAETVYVAAQVADALRWAHSKGVIHRDLKPANVRLDAQGRVIVLDFGIAKISSMPSALTQMGVKVGTPYYMAPEQIRGQPIDQRADLYSLGVMMFQLVIGKRPFEAENNEAIWHAHVSTPPPVPHELDPAVPPPLSHIILRLLEKEPDKRYQSADKVIEHLKMLGASETPPTLRPQAGGDLEKWRSIAPEERTPSLTRGSGSFTPTTAARSPGTSRVAATPAPVEAPRPRRSIWPLFAVLGVLLVLGLGITLYFVLPRGPEPQAEHEGPPEVLHTATGDMYLIPGGEFIYGANDQVSPNPLRTMKEGDFYLDATEVPNAAYKQFCDATSRPYPDAPPSDPQYFENKLDYPVVNVSLEDAEAFAKWANKRLPTQEEWEKAARGTDGRTYPWGNDPPTQQANIEGSEDGFDGIAPVNALPQGASPYGLLNMIGNVWEWTASPYSPAEQEIADLQAVLPNAGSQWAVIKGGFFLSSRNDPDLRTYLRGGFPASAKSPYTGFRCAMDVPKQ